MLLHTCNYCLYYQILVFFLQTKKGKKETKRLKINDCFVRHWAKMKQKNIHNLIKLTFMPQANIVWIKMKLIKFGLANQQRYNRKKYNILMMHQLCTQNLWTAILSFYIWDIRTKTQIEHDSLGAFVEEMTDRMLPFDFKMSAWRHQVYTPT